MQSVSAIGLKYLELEKGTSRQTLKPGQTIPVTQVREPVDIDELFNMFDQKTRTAIQNNTINFGDGLAGRGHRAERNDRDAAPAGDQRDPGAAQPRLAADGLSQPVPRARPGRLAGGAGGETRRPRSTAISTPSSRPGRASRRRWNRRSRAARRRSNRRPTRSPTRRRSSKRPPSSCACCARARARCAPSPRSSATRSRWAPSTCARPPR